MSETRAVLIEVEELEKPKTSKNGIFSHRHHHHQKTAPGGPPKPPHGSKTMTTFDDDDDVNIKKNRCYPCF